MMPDKHAGRCQRSTDEDRTCKVEPEEDSGCVATYPGYDHAEEAYNTVAWIDDVLDIELETDDEEEEDGPEMRQGRDEVRVSDQAEHARSDQNPHENRPDRRRLVDAGCHKVAGEREEEKEAHLNLNC